jgi:hypothetical protein
MCCDCSNNLNNVGESSISDNHLHEKTNSICIKPFGLEQHQFVFAELHNVIVLQLILEDIGINPQDLINFH